MLCRSSRRVLTLFCQSLESLSASTEASPSSSSSSNRRQNKIKVQKLRNHESKEGQANPPSTNEEEEEQERNRGGFVVLGSGEHSSPYRDRKEEVLLRLSFLPSFLFFFSPSLLPCLCVCVRPLGDWFLEQRRWMG